MSVAATRQATHPTPIASPALTPAPVHRVRTTCRACGADTLRRFLALGPQPLANAFPRDPSEIAAEQFFPLDVYFCETCSLVQLADVIDPTVLFSDYIYVTGTSDTIAEHNVRYAQAVAAASASARPTWSWRWRATTAACSPASSARGVRARRRAGGQHRGERRRSRRPHRQPLLQAAARAAAGDARPGARGDRQQRARARR